MEEVRKRERWVEGVSTKIKISKSKRFEVDSTLEGSWKAFGLEEKQFIVISAGGEKGRVGG